MKIASFNVNSIRARTPHVQDFLKAQSPDILMVQELKTVGENFPHDDFTPLGYIAIVIGQKAYNGVATFYRKDLTLDERIVTALPGDAADEQARFLDVGLHGVRYINIYLPNGNPVDSEKFPYKLAWMARLYDYLKDYTDRRIPFVIGGDFNIIPEDIDCHDPAAWEGDALFRPESRAAYRRLLGLGLTEAYRTLHPGVQDFTFWDYQAGAWPQNKGIRIDHFLLSPAIADVLRGCVIDRDPRAQDKASDHTPIIVQIEEQAVRPCWRPDGRKSA